MSPKDDNYIARLTAYVSKNLSGDFDIELQDSIEFTVLSSSYQLITNFQNNYYKKNLNEIYEMFKSEYLDRQ